MYLFLKNMQLFTSQGINWWTGVVWITCRLLRCFYQLFGLSFWRHPFTAEHPLLSKWCNATCLQICSHLETKYILDLLRVSTFSAIGWTISLILKNFNIYTYIFKLWISKPRNKQTYKNMINISVVYMTKTASWGTDLFPGGQ